MSSPTSPLPARPSLVQLRKQAKELLRDYRANDRAALARIHSHRSRIKSEQRVTLAGPPNAAPDTAYPAG